MRFFFSGGQSDSLKWNCNTECFTGSDRPQPPHAQNSRLLRSLCSRVYMFKFTGSGREALIIPRTAFSCETGKVWPPSLLWYYELENSWNGECSGVPPLAPCFWKVGAAPVFFFYLWSCSTFWYKNIELIPWNRKTWSGCLFTSHCHQQVIKTLRKSYFLPLLAQTLPRFDFTVAWFMHAATGLRQTNQRTFSQSQTCPIRSCCHANRVVASCRR
jgi:hypothetical protein